MCAMAVLYAPTCGEGNKVLQHTQDCVACCSSLVIFSSTAGEFDCTVFLLKHKEGFLKSVNTHALQRHCR